MTVFVVLLLVVAGMAILFGGKVMDTIGEEHAAVRRKAEAYDRLRQMEALRWQSRDGYRDIVQSHARETERIVREARR